MDSDLKSKMLSALMFNNDTTITKAAPVSVAQQIHYMLSNVDSLRIEDRKYIGTILIMNDKLAALRPCSEGTMINLNNLHPEIIQQMYNFVVYRRENRS